MYWESLQDSKYQAVLFLSLTFWNLKLLLLVSSKAFEYIQSCNLSSFYRCILAWKREGFRFSAPRRFEGHRSCRRVGSDLLGQGRLISWVKKRKTTCDIFPITKEFYYLLFAMSEIRHWHFHPEPQVLKPWATSKSSWSPRKGESTQSTCVGITNLRNLPPILISAAGKWHHRCNSFLVLFI